MFYCEMSWNMISKPDLADYEILSTNSVGYIKNIFIEIWFDVSPKFTYKVIEN